MYHSSGIVHPMRNRSGLHRDYCAVELRTRILHILHASCIIDLINRTESTVIFNIPNHLMMSYTIAGSSDFVASPRSRLSPDMAIGRIISEIWILQSGVISSRKSERPHFDDLDIHPQKSSETKIAGILLHSASFHAYSKIGRC